ncbi:MAG: PilZ domain-containing protein [Planctomycetaceae bacterium]|nr:PilZ domain-containing protein [Planctomycetaceae bacterium]
MTQQAKERRQFTRVAISCPVTIFSRAGTMLGSGRSVDLSDGGTYVAVAAEVAQSLDGAVNLAFSVPRSTQNTFMLEEFACHAKLIRCQDGGSDDRAGVALQFARPLNLGLRV